MEFVQKQRTVLWLLAMFTSVSLFAQDSLKTVWVDGLNANGTQALRYEVAQVGYNSYHWQKGGVIFIELYQGYYGTGYDKFSVEVGFGQGTNTTKYVIKHLATSGLWHDAKVSFGIPSDLSTNIGGAPNKKLPIYIDVRSYTQYRARISFLHKEVDVVSHEYEIHIDKNPTGTNIQDFTVPKGLNAITVTEDGLIGLGNESPVRKLQIGALTPGTNSDGNADLLSSEGIIVGSGKYISLDHNNQTHASMKYSTSVSNEARFVHQGYYGHAFTVRTDQPAFTILGNNGYVGVGTVSPQEKLDLESGQNTFLRVATSSDQNTSLAGILLQHKRPDSNLYSTHRIYADPYNLFFDIDESATFKNNGTTSLYLSPNGSMGVGTDEIPSTYKMAVKGHALFEKVVVRKNANWPDYVFEKGYKLPTLYEVDKFINEHKHLPEIPSAQEIEANGQDLGEMNSLLLKKVEELTLYVIQLRKEMDRMKAKK